jgi:hypothetical protein
MEKLANHIALQSIVEGGMDKSAGLPPARLIQMATTFARRGKLDRFNKPLESRHSAMANVGHKRLVAREKLKPAAELEQTILGGNAGPALKAYQRAAARVPHDVGVRGIVHDSPMLESIGLGSMKDPSTGFTRLSDPRPIPYDNAAYVADLIKSLRSNAPDELAKITQAGDKLPLDYPTRGMWENALGKEIIAKNALY